jgi:hypothetical protein
MSSVLIKIFLDINDSYLGEMEVSLDDTTQRLFPEILKLSPIKDFRRSPSLLFSKFTATHKQRPDGLIMKCIPFGPYLKVLHTDNLPIREVLGNIPMTWNSSQSNYADCFDLVPIDWVKVSIY